MLRRVGFSEQEVHMVSLALAVDEPSACASALDDPFQRTSSSPPSLSDVSACEAPSSPKSLLRRLSGIPTTATAVPFREKKFHSLSSLSKLRALVGQTRPSPPGSPSTSSCSHEISHSSGFRALLGASSRQTGTLAPSSPRATLSRKASAAMDVLTRKMSPSRQRMSGSESSASSATYDGSSGV